MVRFHALQYSDSASMTLPHQCCDRRSFTVQALSYKVLLSLTAVDYCCTSSELTLSIVSLNTQNCACLKGVISAGAPCSCPRPKPLRGLYISRGHKYGAVLATFPFFYPCFENIFSVLKFLPFGPLHASRAHRGCKILVVEII
jgi:hypothetical protein